MELPEGEAVGVFRGEGEGAGVAEVALELILVPVGQSLDREFDGVGAPDGSLAVRSHRDFRMTEFEKWRYSTKGSRRGTSGSGGRSIDFGA